MKKQITRRFLLIVGLALFAGIIALPSSWISSFLGQNLVTEKLSEFKVVLGLDLAGGTELDYKIDLSDAIAQNNDDDPDNNVDVNIIAESVRDALEKRVNPAGVGEIVVKRSQVNGDEHVIVQIPPSSNVEQAKADAEKDNRLEFFEESPEKLNTKRIEIAQYLTDITPGNWNIKTEQILKEEESVEIISQGPFSKDEIIDAALAEKIFEAPENSILTEIIETQTEMQTTISEEGEVEILNFPEPILGIVYVKEKTSEKRTVTQDPKAEARHILFGYQGALRAPEDVPYPTAEEARAKAQEILDLLQGEEDSDFEALAKEYSTEPAAQESGGNLGTFSPGQMAGPFNDAVFESEKTGLIPQLIETDFGYHIIEVLSKTEKSETTEDVELASYEMLYWKVNDLLWVPTDLGGAQMENATPGFNEVGQYSINLLFNNEGAKLFGEITERVAGRTCEMGPCRLGIKVGGEWVTQPTVREKINSKNAQITGQFTAASAREMADDLNLGAIDAPVSLSGQTTISPDLGIDQLEKSLKAGFYGLIATMIFMILFYRFAGFVATLALIIYTLLFIMILKIWPESLQGPIVLTLSGIAGVILSLGLAVDGNILIFERMKEELRKGRSLRQAVDLGFERAWNAVRDSNLTTLLTCIILFVLGSSLIKGFAITLIVGTLLSLFSAIFVTRTLLLFFLLFKPFNNKKLYGVNPNEETQKTLRTRK